MLEAVSNLGNGFIEGGVLYLGVALVVILIVHVP